MAAGGVAVGAGSSVAGGVAVGAGSGADGVRGAVQAASAIKMSVKTKILFIFPSFCEIFRETQPRPGMHFRGCLGSRLP